MTWEAAIAVSVMLYTFVGPPIAIWLGLSGAPARAEQIIAAASLAYPDSPVASRAWVWKHHPEVGLPEFPWQLIAIYRGTVEHRASMLASEHFSQRADDMRFELGE